MKIFVSRLDDSGSSITVTGFISGSGVGSGMYSGSGITSGYGTGMGFGSLCSPSSGIISGSVSSSGVVSGVGACITVFSLYSVNTCSPTPQRNVLQLRLC
ncbi:MAG: hypothetical protein J4F36_14295 [Nitrosopumilaceae archaeon]|nr:hypothetical protein [Nitrosopumilaceae archaeon]